LQSTGTRLMIENQEKLFNQLHEDKFRSKFHLNEKDGEYLERKGLEEISEHARKFVAERLAPALPKRDGKQTPYRGHPVFVSQHATATCCRGCLSKWHSIPKKVELSPEQQDYVVRVIMHWLEMELERKVCLAVEKSS
jgi:hypothetical protein